MHEIPTLPLLSMVSLFCPFVPRFIAFAPPLAKTKAPLVDPVSKAPADEARPISATSVPLLRRKAGLEVLCSSANLLGELVPIPTLPAKVAS